MSKKNDKKERSAPPLPKNKEKKSVKTSEGMCVFKPNPAREYSLDHRNPKKKKREPTPNRTHYLDRSLPPSATRPIKKREVLVLTQRIIKKKSIKTSKGMCLLKANPTHQLAPKTNQCRLPFSKKKKGYKDIRRNACF
jgi:hypothetical protein